MNFFRDEKGAKEMLGAWFERPYMYQWELYEAQENAFKIFSLE